MENEMNNRNTIGALIGGAAMAAAAMGLTAGLAPATAAPAGARLSVFPVNTEIHRVTIEGVFPMQQADAVGFINNINTGAVPGEMSYAIYGDDPTGISNRGVHRFPGAGVQEMGHLIATPEGLHYLRILELPRGVLNEDDNAFDNEDEIYVRAMFVDADGGTRAQISNVVTANF
jgi:hypothetical protein